jgi:hypothetical protein
MSAAADTFNHEFANAYAWAAMYRGLGLQVVPAGDPAQGPNWKRPSLPQWTELQTSLAPETTFSRWYDPEIGKHRTRDNMGLIMGLASGGVFCVDLDLHKDTGMARQWWADLLAENAHGVEPVTPSQRTGGGGRHILFRAPEGWASPTFKTSVGIDIRGQGGFMMAAPSRHESGREYAWEEGREPWLTDTAPAPEWLVEAIEALREQYAPLAGGGAARTRTEGAEKYRAEGVRFEEIDEREETMHRLIWGVLCDLRRRSPDDTEPFPGDAADEFDRAWGVYLEKVGSRLTDPNATKEALLEREGRGKSEFRRKWQRAVKQWNGKLKEAAAEPRPGEPPPSKAYTRDDDGTLHDPETGEVFEPEPGPPPASDFPDHLTRPPGLLGDIIDWIEATSRHPSRAMALGVALGVVGTVAGRKYATPTKSGTHIYALALAPTGAGKNHAPKQAKRLLRAAGLGDLIGPSQYMSMSAVFATLGKSPRHVSFIDEFGGYMTRIASAKGSPHERAVKDILRTAWGASFEELRPLSYADGRVIEPVISPALSICGMSTPEEFYKALAGDDVFNGFLNRFLIIRISEKPHEVEPKEDEFDPPGSLLWGIARIKDRVSGALADALHDESRPILRLNWASPEAAAVYTVLRRDMERREDDAALVSRVAEMACRLATIRAIGRDLEEPTVAVRKDDIEWGRDLALWSAERMIQDAQDFMAETENQARAMQILRLIREAPDRQIKHSDLLRKLKHRFDAKAIVTILEGLIGAEQVALIETQTPGAGRKGRAYAYLG